MSKNSHRFTNSTFKYLLIGSNGLLGKAIKKKISKKQIKTLARKKASFNLNLENFSKLEKVFKKYKFRYVINCAAITDLKKCQKNFDKCKKINSLLPKYLSKFSSKYNFKLIQISTDQFFVNKKFKLNKENDKIFPVNEYARSKMMCENFVKKNKSNLIIRTNFTGFKHDGKNSTFIEWLTSSIRAKKKVNLFNDLFVSTIDVNTCASLILNLIKIDACGIYNCSANTAISKKQFALYFSKKIKKNLIFNDVSVSIDHVKRQKYLGLDTKKIEKKLGKNMISPYKAINNLAKEYLKN